MSGANIYNTACSFIGTKYVWGGDPNWFDCSGLVYYVHRILGYNCPRTTGDLLYGGLPGNGSIGELCCWNGHVGICDGNGNVVHAYGSNNGSVRINKIDDCSRWDNRPFLGYRRFIFK